MQRSLILTTLADELRVAILRRLREGRARAGDLARELHVPGSTLSFHLRKLEEAELVRCDRRGRERWYSLAPAVRRRGGNLLITTPSLRITLRNESQ